MTVSKYIKKKAYEILANNQITLIDATGGNLHFIIKSQGDNGFYDVFRSRKGWSVYTKGVKKVGDQVEVFGREFNDPKKSAYIQACSQWLQGLNEG